MITLLAALVLAAGDAASATAASSPAAPAAASAEPKKPDEEKVCRTETPLGTRFSHKVCYTRAQLEQRRADDEQGLRQSQGPAGSYARP